MGAATNYKENRGNRFNINSINDLPQGSKSDFSKEYLQALSNYSDFAVPWQMFNDEASKQQHKNVADKLEIRWHS